MYAAMGHLVDSKTGKPLFNAAAWKMADNVLNGILNLLLDDGVTFTGVSVSGGLLKIGRDFNIDELTSVSQKDRPNVINLGIFARERDVVQNGTVELADLCELVFEAKFNKSVEVRLSNWAASLTDPQKKYAALDAIISLLLFLKLKELPDLTK